MHSDQPYFLQKPMHLLFLDHDHCFKKNPPLAAPVLNGAIMTSGSKPLILPSNACPRNLIIFDQTSNRSQIMFHPKISSRFCFPSSAIDSFQDNGDENDEKENSADIDALLSTEDEEESDEEVSTARTSERNYECNSQDLCSNYKSLLSSKSRSFFRKNHCNDKKRYRTRKVLNALRGIVPGANRMSTIDVLDEAVRYLKSLRVQVQKMEVGNLNGQDQ